MFRQLYLIYSIFLIVTCSEI